jgi:hypothetical protein
MLPVDDHVLLPGWYSSAAAVPPPAMRTLPSGRRVAVAPDRRTFMAPVGMNVLTFEPDAGIATTAGAGVLVGTGEGVDAAAGESPGTNPRAIGRPRTETASGMRPARRDV